MKKVMLLFLSLFLVSCGQEKEIEEDKTKVMIDSAKAIGKGTNHIYYGFEEQGVLDGNNYNKNLDFIYDKDGNIKKINEEDETYFIDNQEYRYKPFYDGDTNSKTSITGLLEKITDNKNFNLDAMASNVKEDYYKVLDVSNSCEKVDVDNNTLSGTDCTYQGVGVDINYVLDADVLKASLIGDNVKYRVEYRLAQDQDKVSLPMDKSKAIIGKKEDQ